MAPYATYQVVLPSTRTVTTEYFLDQQPSTLCLLRF